MFKVTNLEQVFGEIDRWQKEVEEELKAVAKGLMFEAFTMVLDHSAQYSGDFAANWKLQVNEPDTNFKEDLFPLHKWPSKIPFLMGSLPAIRHAVAQNVHKLDNFKLGDTLWLSNSAAHHESYAWKIEDSRIKFRPGNYGGPVATAMSTLTVQYHTIDRHNIGLLV